ncbi:S8 family serine peptidase [Anatilimnocola floriformis]|uniref:S8 family serine peptidase n=1 Tax=Anatilimnocola floriformis TaxID=2948575 RepID=UPI0020C3B283|nr:S8 family serine peptidase [Anatilimnocola floriformis]
MAKTRGRGRTRPQGNPPPAAPVLPPEGSDSSMVGDATAGEYTGKYLVLLRADVSEKKATEAIKSACGASDVCSASSFANSAVDMEQADQADILYLDEIKVAVVDVDPRQAGDLRAAADDEGNNDILAVEPERIMYALNEPAFPFEYLKGYRDAVNHLYDQLRSQQPTDAISELEASIQAADNAQFTWGLQATRVNTSRFAGRNIRVAVLDTGFDLDHPDFVGRSVTSRSFISGQAVDDFNGHGTHCIGTALGPQQPAGGVRRYGCSFGGSIFVGKVLSNQGSGADNGILAGINWAIANNCRIISMSLGSPVQPGESFSPLYENIAQRALNSNPGTLIIAAAGNDSRSLSTGLRLNPPRPVGRPANCPSIMAVASLDSNLAVSAFSNGTINPVSGGGGVDLAGPGGAVFSSVPTPFPANVQPAGGGRPWPARYHTISGTSMATPHVAGIAAMWLEARPNTPALALWQLLLSNARRLSISSRDVGVGLVQAPQF